VGADESVIVGLVDLATNVYHTSSLAVTPQPIAGIVVYVPANKVPLVLTQVGLEVRLMAFSQASFTGGSETQILKFQEATLPAVALVPLVNTRTR
jgi:hypothetical protein